MKTGMTRISGTMGLSRIRELSGTMKMSGKKRLLLPILAMVMLVLFTGCGGGGGSESRETSKNYVYKAEEVKLDIKDAENMDMRYLNMSGGRLYTVGSRYDREKSILVINSFAPDGSDLKTVEAEYASSINVGTFAMDDEGNLFGVLNEYVENASNPDDVVYEDNYYLVRFNPDGSEAWRTKLNENIPPGEYYYVNSLLFSKEKGLLLFGGNQMEIYGLDGKLQKKVQLKEGAGGSVYGLASGKLIMTSYEEGGLSLRELNPDTGELMGDYTIPGNSYRYNLYTGKDFDFYLVGTSDISGYNLGDTEVTPLMNFVDSDMDISYMVQLICPSRTEWYSLLADNVSNKMAVVKLTKVDPKDVVDKKELVLGCYGMNWNVRSQVVKFNKTNGSYRIRIKDYSEYDTEEDYTAGLTRLNTDIVSGKVPDIMLLSSQLPASSYIAKGLFEDLNPYLDKDEEINRADLLENILNAYSVDGKLYQMVPNFYLFSVAGKTADVGSEPGWTLAELKTLLASKPEGTKAFANILQSDILTYSMEMSSEQFINWETGECHFDGPEFTELLEFAKQFPKEYEDVGIDPMERDYGSENSESMYRDGRTLLSICNIGSFKDYNYLKKGTFGEDITLIGFPAANRNGTVILSDLNFAMSSKSKYKDGAWEFIRHFLTDDYQKEQTYNFSISRKQLERMAEEAQKRPTYVDENGNTVETDDYYYLGDMEIKITPMTQAEVDEVMKVLTSVNQPQVYDQALMNIILEETAPYFAGQKDVKQVSDIIQSRVRIYVNENR